jgi:hypothetical protein
VTHLGDTEMCDDGPQRDHEEDVNHEPRNSKSLREGQSYFAALLPTEYFIKLEYVST